MCHLKGSNLNTRKTSQHETYLIIIIAVAVINAQRRKPIILYGILPVGIFMISFFKSSLLFGIKEIQTSDFDNLAFHQINMNILQFY